MRADQITIAVIFAGLTEIALPHHAFTPVYQGDQEITIEGVVSDFQYINPHSMLTMELADETGASRTCLVEMAGRLSLSRYGWSDDTVSAGDRITVTGNPARSGACRIFFRRILLPDGSELLDPGDAEQRVLEQLRQQRAGSNTGGN